jgi:hypothetical protein
VLPTMTVYAPEGKSTGSAVVVIHGGRFQTLAVDLEGAVIIQNGPDPRLRIGYRFIGTWSRSEAAATTCARTAEPGLLNQARLGIIRSSQSTAMAASAPAIARARSASTKSARLPARRRYADRSKSR